MQLTTTQDITKNFALLFKCAQHTHYHYDLWSLHLHLQRANNVWWNRRKKSARSLSYWRANKTSAADDDDDDDQDVDGIKSKKIPKNHHRELINSPFLSLSLSSIASYYFFFVVSRIMSPLPIIAVFNSLVTSRYLFEKDFNVRKSKKDQIAHFPSIISFLSISLTLVYSSNVITRQPVSDAREERSDCWEAEWNMKMDFYC